MDTATIVAASLAYLAGCCLLAGWAMRRAQPLDQRGMPKRRQEARHG